VHAVGVTWEYTTINLYELPLATLASDVLNDAGKEGWELVAITSNGMAYFSALPSQRPLRGHRRGDRRGRLSPDNTGNELVAPTARRRKGLGAGPSDCTEPYGRKTGTRSRMCSVAWGGLFG
jgi:hypothetical protein